MTKLTYEELKKELKDFTNVNLGNNSVIVRFETGRVLLSCGSPAAIILYNYNCGYTKYVVSGIWNYSRTTTQDVVAFFDCQDSKELSQRIKKEEIIEVPKF